MRKLAKPVSYVKAFIFINIIFILSAFVNAKVIKCLQSIFGTIENVYHTTLLSEKDKM